MPTIPSASCGFSAEVAVSEVVGLTPWLCVQLPWRCGAKGGEWPHSFRPQTADFGVCSSLKDSCRPFLPSLLPLSISIFLCDFMSDLLISFAVRQGKMKFRWSHYFFLLEDVTISDNSSDDPSTGVLALGARQGQCHFWPLGSLVTCVLLWKPVALLEEETCQCPDHARHLSNFFKKRFFGVFFSGQT